MHRHSYIYIYILYMHIHIHTLVHFQLLTPQIHISSALRRALIALIAVRSDPVQMLLSRSYKLCTSHSRKKPTLVFSAPAPRLMCPGPAPPLELPAPAHPLMCPGLFPPLVLHAPTPPSFSHSRFTLLGLLRMLTAPRPQWGIPIGNTNREYQPIYIYIY